MITPRPAGSNPSAWPDGLTLIVAPVVVLIVMVLAGYLFVRTRWGGTSGGATRRRRVAPVAPASTRWIARCGPVPHLHVVVVEAGAPAVGRSPEQLVLWRHYGLMPVGVWRYDAWIVAPCCGFHLRSGDRLVVSGTALGVLQSRHLFRPPCLSQLAGDDAFLNLYVQAQAEVDRALEALDPPVERLGPEATAGLRAHPVDRAHERAGPGPPGRDAHRGRGQARPPSGVEAVPT